MLLLINSIFSYPTSILGLQDLKPLNIVLLEPDTNNLTSILDQDKYTCYQDSLEDENYVPGIEEIALILSTKVKNFCFSQRSDFQIMWESHCAKVQKYNIAKYVSNFLIQLNKVWELEKYTKS